jgi:hypothetical protein
MASASNSCPRPRSLLIFEEEAFTELYHSIPTQETDCIGEALAPVSTCQGPTLALSLTRVRFRRGTRIGTLQGFIRGKKFPEVTGCPSLCAVSHAPRRPLTSKPAWCRPHLIMGHVCGSRYTQVQNRRSWPGGKRAGIGGLVSSRRWGEGPSYSAEACRLCRSLNGRRTYRR